MFPIAGPPVIHLTATTRDIPGYNAAGALGEYRLSSEQHQGREVYAQQHSDSDSSSSYYLYRTQSAWYCGYKIGQEKSGLCFRNSNLTSVRVPTTGWEYMSSTWHSCPSLSVGTGTLPPCGVLTVQHGGDGDGEYHLVPGKYSRGRNVYIHAVEPHYTLSVCGEYFYWRITLLLCARGNLEY